MSLSSLIFGIVYLLLGAVMLSAPGRFVKLRDRRDPDVTKRWMMLCGALCLVGGLGLIITSA